MLDLLLSYLSVITNEFCDLVLGPLPAQEAKWSGEMVEVYAEDPALLEDYVEQELLSHSDLSIALLGFEVGRFQCAQKKAGTRIVMPATNAAQLIFAAGELLLSNAVDVIAIYELLLQVDNPEVVIEELHRIHRLIGNTNSRVILLNPDTPFRRRNASELSILCSRQISLR